MTVNTESFPQPYEVTSKDLEDAGIEAYSENEKPEAWEPKALTKKQLHDTLNAAPEHHHAPAKKAPAKQDG